MKRNPTAVFAFIDASAGWMLLATRQSKTQPRSTTQPAVATTIPEIQATRRRNTTTFGSWASLPTCMVRPRSSHRGSSAHATSAQDRRDVRPRSRPSPSKPRMAHSESDPRWPGNRAFRRSSPHQEKRAPISGSPSSALDESVDPAGIRTRVYAVRGHRPRPLDDGAFLQKRVPHKAALRGRQQVNAAPRDLRLSRARRSRRRLPDAAPRSQTTSACRRPRPTSRPRNGSRCRRRASSSAP